MKKRISFCSALVFLFLCMVPGCDIFSECGTCEYVTIDAEGNETRSAPQPFCGESLQEKLNDVPETIDGVTTYWDCY